MNIYKILPDGFGCNSYIISKDGKNAIVIDCAQPKVYDAVLQRGLTPVAVLLTHGHFDHIGGCGMFSENGVPIYCAEAEKQVALSDYNMSKVAGVYVAPFEIKDGFHDGEELTFCGINIKVISTPGHTVGGVCYLIDDCLFTGDTLFRGSVGRTDLPTGSARQILESVKKLFALEGDYKVYCGHDRETTLEQERKYNPYVKY